MTCLEDFYLFFRMKLTLKRRSFYDAADIIKNAMEELKRLSQNRYVSNIFTLAGRRELLQKGKSLKEIWIIIIQYFVFLRN